VPTLGALLHQPYWLWLRCSCGHRVPVAIVPFVIRWGADASSDILRKHARCTVCGRRGASLQHPSWGDAETGWEAFPMAQPGVPEQRMKATPDERDTDVQRADRNHAPARPGDGTGLRFETGEHGGDYPDNMPQAITVTDGQGRWAVYVPLRVGGKIVVPELPAHCG